MRCLIAALAVVCAAASGAAMAASTEAEYKAALAAAQAAEYEAGALKDQWTTTEEALAAARKAAAASDFETATNAAKQAEALAKASIAQAKEQDTAWRAAVIR